MTEGTPRERDLGPTRDPGETPGFSGTHPGPPATIPEGTGTTSPGKTLVWKDLDRLRGDPEFAPLRDRDDFLALLDGENK
jgi:hypothetical protein